uniref:GLTP domain-containing protein n=1 Tax=Caenorhabditis japonica TaxID=281687 RepID=A0A8R1HGP4_CAEJA
MAATATVEPGDVADQPGHETYFAKPAHFFPHLTDDSKIPTAQFLSACQGIADFVSFLGTTFIPVRKDIQGNVDKVRARFEKDQEGQKYLQDLIDADLSEHNGKFGIATEGLLWLKRGLQFMLELLSEMVTSYNSGTDHSKTEDLSSAVSNAYAKSLKRHHGFMAKQVFKAFILNFGIFF